MKKLCAYSWCHLTLNTRDLSRTFIDLHSSTWTLRASTAWSGECSRCSFNSVIGMILKTVYNAARICSLGSKLMGRLGEKSSTGSRSGALRVGGSSYEAKPSSAKDHCSFLIRQRTCSFSNLSMHGTLSFPRIFGRIFFEGTYPLRGCVTAGAGKFLT